MGRRRDRREVCEGLLLLQGSITGRGVRMIPDSPALRTLAPWVRVEEKPVTMLRV